MATNQVQHDTTIDIACRFTSRNLKVSEIDLSHLETCLAMAHESSETRRSTGSMPTYLDSSDEENRKTRAISSWRELLARAFCEVNRNLIEILSARFFLSGKPRGFCRFVQFHKARPGRVEMTRGTMKRRTFLSTATCSALLLPAQSGSLGRYVNSLTRLARPERNIEVLTGEPLGTESKESVRFQFRPFRLHDSRSH